MASGFRTSKRDRTNGRKALCLGASLLLWACALEAASISGTVTGADGEPFKGAFVQAQNVKTKITVSVLSDKSGNYQIEDLPAGDYDVGIRALGYKAEPHTGISLSAQQKATAQFSLQKSVVLWSDLSLYQAEKLLPDAPGKRVMMTDGTTPGRDSPCQICHSYQNKIAPYVRDESGWRGKVEYMVGAMGFTLGPGTIQEVNKHDQDALVSYLTALFGPNSILPQSPADKPEYKDTVHTFGDDAMNIVYVEYELPGPNRMPWSAVPDGKGNLWMPYYGDVNKIARLNELTGEVKEYRVPNAGTAGVHSIVPAPDGGAWFTEAAGRKLGHWDPRTEQITEYPDTGSKHTVRVGPHGTLCASGQLALFDPETGKFTDFPQRAYGVVIDGTGNCWFTEYSKAGKIGRIDASTAQLQTWNPPVVKDHTLWSRRIQIDSEGMIWFDESEGNQVVRFDPKAQTFKEYPLPGPLATPYAMNLDKNHDVWYASEYMDLIGRLNTTTGKVTEYPFPHAENTMREFFYDSKGRMWFATPANNKVGYFYLAQK